MESVRAQAGAGELASLRLFYALWPDERIRAALAAMQGSIAGRATEPNNLHLTLAFLGQQPSERVPVLQRILLALPKLEIVLLIDKSGYFPRNRIAWVGAGETPRALIALYESLTLELEREGIPFDRAARFKPHITLARAAAAGPGAVLRPIRWRVQTVALVESVPGLGRAHYQVLSSCSLK